MSYAYKQLSSTDISSFKALMELFAEVFEEKQTYQDTKPSDNYIKNFLSDRSHIVLVAKVNNFIVGGLVAYELKKFEQKRSEIYIYDLAVSMPYRKKGIGTSLIENLKRIAKKHGAYTIFVQADKNDKEALSFYRSLNTKQIESYNFDIEL